MNKESLIKAAAVITDALMKSDIDTKDKMELLINLQNLLMNYERDIKKLMKK